MSSVTVGIIRSIGMSTPFREVHPETLRWPAHSTLAWHPKVVFNKG